MNAEKRCDVFLSHNALDKPCVERTVAWICKLDHVRETIPFPRMLEKIYP